MVAAHARAETGAVAARIGDLMEPGHDAGGARAERIGQVEGEAPAHAEAVLAVVVAAEADQHEPEVALPVHAPHEVGVAGGGGAEDHPAELVGEPVGLLVAAALEDHAARHGRGGQLVVGGDVVDADRAEDEQEHQRERAGQHADHAAGSPLAALPARRRDGHAGRRHGRARPGRRGRRPRHPGRTGRTGRARGSGGTGRRGVPVAHEPPCPDAVRRRAVGACPSESIMGRGSRPGRSAATE